MLNIICWTLNRSDKRASNVDGMSLKIESFIKVTLVIELRFPCIISFYMIYAGLQVQLLL